ncbi:MAG: lipoyl(octanoyl) transferase [Actinomycetota bacterium]|nr:lipoyl(octanoyl) transferase [Actinomycetota bacterium]
MGAPRDVWLLSPERPVPYDEANRWMHRLAERRLADEIPDALILVEHPPVFTAGRRARPEHLVWTPEEAAARGAEIRHIDRGGSFTFHGPGQLVAYPILDLGSRPDAGAHLRAMEEIVIRAAREVGVELERRPDVQTGVFSGPDKVCAIGIRLMRARVSLHGFALNCDTDLRWFDGIVACGLPGNGVTSLSRLAGRPVTVAEMQPHIQHHASEVFGVTLSEAPESERSGALAAETIPVR